MAEVEWDGGDENSYVWGNMRRKRAGNSKSIAKKRRIRFGFREIGLDMGRVEG